VIQGALVLDDGGLADHHAHAMVNEDAAPDRRPRMNLDAGNPAREMGQRTRHPAQTGGPQPVRNPVQGKGMETRIAGQHLPGGSGGRIAFENAGDVFTQMSEHG
jgi:hypothetical protein